MTAICARPAVSYCLCWNLRHKTCKNTWIQPSPLVLTVKSSELELAFDFSFEVFWSRDLTRYCCCLQRGRTHIVSGVKDCFRAIRFLNVAVQFMSSRFCVALKNIWLPLIACICLFRICWVTVYSNNWGITAVLVREIKRERVQCWPNTEQSNTIHDDCCSCSLLSHCVAKPVLSKLLPNDMTSSGFAVAMCTSIPAAAAGVLDATSKGQRISDSYSLLDRWSLEGRRVFRS